MRKRFKLAVGLLLFHAFTPAILAVEEVNASEKNPPISSFQANDSLSSQETFEAKTKAEREQLPQSEQEVINDIESYLQKNANPRARNFEAILHKLVAKLVFDITVNRENTVIDTAEFFGLLGGSKTNAWFENVSGKSDRYLSVYDAPTRSNVTLHAFYVDNQSDKTAIVQHGYRSNALNLMEEAEMLYNQGYNVLIPDARSHGRSGGRYITFGAYEKNDINAWIEQELANKPEQKIVLLGVSMGAAIVMMSQETPHPNVQALIEDCGYYSIEQQARDVARLIIEKLQYIPLVQSIDWYAHEDKIINSLNHNYVKPILKIDLFSISPLQAVAKSPLPKLFIHGTADWFIRPVAMEKLYAASSGYKEKFYVSGAGHAENITVGGILYRNRVTAFLATVEKMYAAEPAIAN